MVPGSWAIAVADVTKLFWGGLAEGLWKFWLKTKLECFELCGLFCGGLGDKSVGNNNGDGGGMDYEISEERLRILQRLLDRSCYILNWGLWFLVSCSRRISYG